jgi:hypothetical protein
LQAAWGLAGHERFLATRPSSATSPGSVPLSAAADRCVLATLSL